MQEWFVKNAARVALVAIALALLAALLWLRSCEGARSAATVNRLNAGQAGAALESGHDAGATIDNRTQADAASDQVTRENHDAILNAQGADAPVAAPVRDAGIASLCRRAAYRRDPKCVQHADPR